MKDLKIYFTSDVHGYIYPTDYTDTTQKPLGFLNMLNQFDKDGNTLIMDGGDTIQGSPFTTLMSRKNLEVNPLATVMNAGGYDYVALGNHDFNYGYTYLQNFLNHLNAKALCTNVTDNLQGLPIFPSAIHTLENGLKVGIIGFTTDFIPVWEKAQNLVNFTVSDTIASIKPHFDALKDQVDVMIGIYHGGFEYDLETHDKLSESSENVAYAICKTYDFDVLLTGHQHLPIANQELFGTHIIQTPHYGSTYAKVLVNVLDDGNIQTTSELVKTALDYNEDLYNELLPLETEVQVWLDEPVGFLDAPLNPSAHLDMALHGSRLANFINQVQLDRSGADIACCSFANSIKGFNQAVTVRDIVSTYIYPNTLVVLEVSGEILKAALENTASYFKKEGDTIGVSDKFLKPKVAHYNYDYFSNINYTFEINNPVGERVTSILFNGKQVQADDTLTLVMNNYRHSGVGGYSMYPGCKVVKEIMVEMPEIIIDYFTKHPHVTVDSASYFTVID